MDLLAQIQAWAKITFWRKRDHRAASAGTADAGLPVTLNSLGKLAISLLTPIVGNLTLTGILTVTSDFISGSSAFLAGTFGTARTQFDKTGNGTMLLHRESANTGAPTLEFLKRRSGWGVVSNGDRLGTIGFSGADSVDAAIAASIHVEVDGTPGSNDMPGAIVFSVAPDGSAIVAQAMRIANDKTVTWAGGFGAWTNITFGTGWDNFGGGFQTGQYRKIGDMVYLRGMVLRTSGVGTTITTLPAAHWPPATVLCDVQSASALGRIDISTAGVVTFIAGTAGTWINLSDIPPFSII